MFLESISQGSKRRSGETSNVSMDNSRTSAGVKGARVDEGADAVERALGALEINHLSCCGSPTIWFNAVTSLLARKSFIRSSTLAIRSLRCRLPFFAGDSSSGISWLIQVARRRWQPMQVTSSDDAKVHLIFRRLHSQHDCVPLRTFLRLTDTSSSTLGTSVISGRCE